MLILGVDPGGVTRANKGAHAGTGISVLSTDNGTIELLEARQVLWSEWELGQALQDYLVRYELDAVVYEDFIARRGIPFSLDPVKLIGSIRASIEPELLHPVAPSAHKSLVKRDWAKSLVLGAGFQVLDGHCVDSTSLALYHGIRKQDQTILGGMQQWLKSK